LNKTEVLKLDKLYNCGKFIYIIKSNDDSYHVTISLYSVMKKQFIRNPKIDDSNKNGSKIEGGNVPENLIKNGFYSTAKRIIKSVLESRTKKIAGKTKSYTTFKYRTCRIDLSSDLQNIEQSNDILMKKNCLKNILEKIKNKNFEEQGITDSSEENSDIDEELDEKRKSYINEEGESYIDEEGINEEGESYIDEEGINEEGESYIDEEDINEEGESYIDEEGINEEGESYIDEEDINEEGELYISEKGESYNSEKQVDEKEHEYRKRKLENYEYNNGHRKRLNNYNNYNINNNNIQQVENQTTIYPINDLMVSKNSNMLQNQQHQHTFHANEYANNYLIIAQNLFHLAMIYAQQSQKKYIKDEIYLIIANIFVQQFQIQLINVQYLFYQANIFAQQSQYLFNQVIQARIISQLFEATYQQTLSKPMISNEFKEALLNDYTKR